MRSVVRQWVGEGIHQFAGDLEHVLEVGSLDVNGGVRDLFTEAGAKKYTGIDIRPGPGVDQVLDIRDAPHKFGLAHFGAIVCLETLEHVDRFWTALIAMWEMLQQDGLLYLTVPIFDGEGAFPLHREPNDYWRFGLDAAPILMAGYHVLRQTGLAPYGMALLGRKDVQL